MFSCSSLLTIVIPRYADTVTDCIILEVNEVAAFLKVSLVARVSLTSFIGTGSRGDCGGSQVSREINSDFTEIISYESYNSFRAETNV